MFFVQLGIGQISKIQRVGSISFLTGLGKKKKTVSEKYAVFSESAKKTANDQNGGKFEKKWQITKCCKIIFLIKMACITFKFLVLAKNG